MKKPSQKISGLYKALIFGGLFVAVAIGVVVILLRWDGPADYQRTEIFKVHPNAPTQSVAVDSPVIPKKTAEVAPVVSKTIAQTSPVAPASNSTLAQSATPASTAASPAVVGSASVASSENSMGVAATARMYAAHASLRDPEVADPDSASNQKILQTMVLKSLARTNVER